jgi:uncharacterized protein YjeT (DUF2065 family)
MEQRGAMRLGRDQARIALGVIRSINGLVALLAPRTMIRRFGLDPEENGAAIYVLRLFGIRTVILGVELLVVKGDRREEALRTGVVIHASDATTAFIAGVRRLLPRRAAALAFVISSINTGLAIFALKRDTTDAKVPA